MGSGFLTGVVAIVDSEGNRVDAPNADGDHAPIELQLGEGLSAESAQNGSLTRVTINAEGGGELDGNVTGDLDNNRVEFIDGDEEDSEVGVRALSFLWADDVSEGEAEIRVSGDEDSGGPLEIWHFNEESEQKERVIKFAGSGAVIGNAIAINELIGGLTLTRRTISTTNVTLDTTTTDSLVFVDASAERNITFPTPTNGRLFVFFIKGTANVTLKRHGSEQINGVSGNYPVPFDDAIVIASSDGTDWRVHAFNDDAHDAGSEQPVMEFSAVDTLRVDNNAPQAPNGDQTDGTMFFVRPGSDVDITGIRFYWHSALGETVKCALYSNAGALLASVNVVTSGAGVYTGTFSSPVTCDTAGAGAGAFNRRLVASVYDVAGVKYTKLDKTSLPSTTWPALPFFGGRRMGWINFALWSAGDNAPTSTANTEVYPVEPVLVEL